MKNFFSRALTKLRHALLGADWAIIHEFHRPPYGGGNQFLLALKHQWETEGLDVGANAVGRRTRGILFNSYNFSVDDLARAKRFGVRAVHRVDGPISVYRGSSDLSVDRDILERNLRFADCTIFQSNYSLRKHEELGFQFRNPRVIPNSVDASIFHPQGRVSFPRDKGRRIRVVASAWSNNPKKGASIFQWLDEHLDHARYEFTFVGRLDLNLKNARAVAAIPSAELARLLREQDIYLAASEDDPCSNALIEGLACGLPAIFRNSGGHPELVGEAGLPFDRAEEIPALLDKIADAYSTYQAKIRVKPMADVAKEYMRALREVAPTP